MDDLEALIDELEQREPGTRERIEEIQRQLEFARKYPGLCIRCKNEPTLAKLTDHSCEDCEDMYDWYCWRCANGLGE